MIKGVSIVICCYNSAKRLPQTLLHIAKQKIPETIACELIVVDNNCTDDTVAVVNSIWKELASSIPLTIIEEKTPGLSSARHKGVASANYEYIIFCDDDNWLEENYCKTVFEILDTYKNIGAVGGQSTAITDHPNGLPDWFENAKFAYAVGKQASISGDISNRMYLWGSGLGFRKTVYQKVYSTLPSLLSDRNGKELSSGGDSECCIRFLLLGYQLYYDERLEFVHFIPSEKLTPLFYEKLEQSFEVAHIVLYYYRLKYSINKMFFFKKAFCVLKSCYNIFLASFIFSKKKHNQYNKLMLLFSVGIYCSSLPKEAKLIEDNF